MIQAEVEKYVYYREKNIVLLHGDCLEILPLLKKDSIDLVATDPPYGLNYNDDGNDLANKRESVFGGNIARMKPNSIPNDGEEAHETLRQMLEVVKGKLLKGGACCCCCCCGGGGPKPLFAQWVLMMDDIIGFKQAVVWDKGGLGMGIHYRRNYEFVLIAQNGSPAHRWNGGNTTPNVWRIPKIIPQETDHPTVKPIELMEQIITLHSNENDIVLDPFLGSGTTAVACKNLNRKCIGIEMEQEYLDMAVERLRQEVLL